MIPILFNTEMVKAILERRKTVTRRVIKPPRGADDIFGHLKEVRQPCVIGDILYVRETWQYTDEHLNEEPGYVYKATDPDWETMNGWKWRPSIHMPKEAARIFLKVTDVRVERVQDITEEEAKKEGCTDNRGFIHSPDNLYDEVHSARKHFEKVWDSTVDKTVKDRYGWEANPWVWVIEFEKIESEG